MGEVCRAWSRGFRSCVAGFGVLGCLDLVACVMDLGPKPLNPQHYTPRLPYHGTPFESLSNGQSSLWGPLSGSMFVWGGVSPFYLNMCPHVLGSGVLVHSPIPCNHVRPNGIGLLCYKRSLQNRERLLLQNSTCGVQG